MFEKLARSAALGTIAGSAAAAAVGVGAFALYAALKDTALGQAGAAGIVAGLFLLVAIGAGLALRGGGGGRASTSGPAEAVPAASNPLAQIAGLRDRAVMLAAQRPLLAGAVGLAAGVYLLRNPVLLTTLIGLAAGRAEGKYEARRRGLY